MESIEFIENLTPMISEMIVKYGTKLLMALLFLFLGSWIIGKVNKVFGAFLMKRAVDASLVPFLKSLVSIVLKVTLYIAVAGVIGVEMTSFIALLGTIGIGVGMALSGTLQNVAGGVVILILRPFNVGDVITTQGVTGSVNAIKIFTTVLKTPDNKTVIIPNAQVANGMITNFTLEDTRRVDLVFGISYGDNIDTAKSIIRAVVESDERVLKDPLPIINVAELGDSSVNLNCRVWAKTTDFWGVYNDTLENVKKAFDKGGISIPFPQRDVHLIKES